MKSKTVWVVLCSRIHPCRWWQNKLAFASGVSLRTNQFLCSRRQDSIDLMEVSLLLWSDQLLRGISNGFRAQRSLLISHFHSHCQSSGPFYLMSGLPAGLIIFGFKSLKITPQSLRFLRLPFIVSFLWSNVSSGLPSHPECRADFVACHLRVAWTGCNSPVLPYPFINLPVSLICAARQLPIVSSCHPLCFCFSVN